MTKLDYLPERALLLAGQVGENLRQVVPPNAGKWLDAGIKIGALKASTRVAGTFVKRNPAALAAVAAGAGVLWYLARRRARQAENGSGDGQSTRVEAKRGNGSRSTARKRSRASSRSTASRSAED